MIEKIKNLKKKLKSKIYFDYDVGKLTWFRTGGKSKVFIIVENELELEIILNTLLGYPYLVIGAASNILIRDNGYNGAILKLGKGFNFIDLKDDSIKVGASILDSNLSKFAKIHSIENFEFFSGIPGTIGGAIKMNAGCFGSETKDVLKSVKFFDVSGNINKLQKNNLKLKYRSSDIKDTDIVTSAIFDLTYGQSDIIDDKLKFIKEQRKNKQPIKNKTSGSTFKNPPNEHAAKLIDQAGCKGLEIGDAQVSLKHSNFLINKGKASANDIEFLGKKIIDKVFNKFNILLDWEIKVVGD